MKIWVSLFSVIVAALIWVGSGFVSKLFLLHQFSERVEGKATHWGVVSQGEEKHFIFAEYRAGDLAGRYLFKNPMYRTKEAAEGAMEVIQRESIAVWCRGNEALLEHEFPVKEGIQTAVTGVLLIYFIFLRRYVNQFSN